MAKEIVDDVLWAFIAPLLPPPKPRPWGHPGRKRLDDRKVLTGILFVLKTGIPWEMFPKEMGCGCGMTCWNRLHEWQAAGAWQNIQHVLLEQLHQADQLDWSRAIVDSSSVRAVGAGEKNRPQSHRPCPARQQASRADRRSGHSAGGKTHRGRDA